MNSSFDTRLKRGLFPKMPQSFADGLLRAAETAGGTQNRSAQTDAAKSSATGSEPKKRRFPVGKVLAGALAAVLVAACVVIAVFGPGIGRNKHGAVDPAVNPLLGRWTLTEVEQNGETVDPETIGLQMDMNFSEDGSVTVSTQTGGAEGQYVYRYAFADNAVELTAESGEIPVLPASGVYDPETNTLRFANEDGDDAVIFSRVLNKQTLLGVWKQVRRERHVEPSLNSCAGHEEWVPDPELTKLPKYLEFWEDGHMESFWYSPPGLSSDNRHYTYTISDGDIQIQLRYTTWDLHYDAAAGTICWNLPDRREYYERASDTVIADPYRQRIIELRRQYPEYFDIDYSNIDLDFSNALNVYVWQTSEKMYSCALASAADKRTESEIVAMQGVTIEDMWLILSTYSIDIWKYDELSRMVKVVPVCNPASSYQYEIDDAYTGRLTWLITGIPYECDDPLYATPMVSAVEHDEEPIGNFVFYVNMVYDVDGDGQFETCMLTYGPTSGLFTFTLSAYRNGTAVYRNTFQTANGYFDFRRMSDGLRLEYKEPDYFWGYPSARYRVTVENGMIVLTNEETGETMEYWGLADPHWNMN